MSAAYTEPDPLTPLEGVRLAQARVRLEEHRAAMGAGCCAVVEPGLSGALDKGGVG